MGLQQPLLVNTHRETNPIRDSISVSKAEPPESEDHHSADGLMMVRRVRLISTLRLEFLYFVELMGYRLTFLR